MTTDSLPTAATRLSLDSVNGAFYGPCSGGDLPIAFKLFGSQINVFVFCDLRYGRPETSAAGSVPDDWVLISRIAGPDERQAVKFSNYQKGRPIRPSVVHEVWRRPNGTDVSIDLRRDLAEDALVHQFAPGQISVFLHHRDGTGEGGSDLWFLAGPDRCETQDNGKRFLLSEVATRLADGAIVVTDGMLADNGFGRAKPFRSHGFDWSPIGIVDDRSCGDRTTLAWRATRVKVALM